MTTAPVAVPHVIPSDHGIVVTSRLRFPDRQSQRAASDTAMARLRRLTGPEGRRWIACFLGTDGQLVLFYEQWTDEGAYQRHAVSLDRQYEDDAVEGGTRLDTVISRLGGRPGSRSDDDPFPGCVALVSIATDGPEYQRRAADMIANVAAEPHPGGIGGHVLFSVDGSRVTLYAEWTSEEAHREAVAGAAFGGQGGIFDGIPGIRGLDMHRYQLYRSATGEQS
jgi:quinol monooxygenase YgiN